MKSKSESLHRLKAQGSLLAVNFCKIKKRVTYFQYIMLQSKITGREGCKEKLDSTETKAQKRKYTKLYSQHLGNIMALSEFQWAQEALS